MFNPFVWMLDYMKDYARYHRTLQELSSLDDRELHDIGINRCEIPYVALDVWKNTRIDHLVYG